MFRHSIVVIFPIDFKDRRQIFFVILSKSERITNFHSPQNCPKTLFSNGFMGNRN